MQRLRAWQELGYCQLHSPAPARHKWENEAEGMSSEPELIQPLRRGGGEGGL